MKTILAKFPSSTAQHFSYFVPEGDDPQPGDWIMTSVAFTNYDPMNREFIDEQVMTNAKFAKVVEVEINVNPKAKKFYILLLSAAELLRRKEVNQRMHADWLKKKQAVEQLENMLKNENKLERFAKLAETNPEAKKLYDIVKGENLVTITQSNPASEEGEDESP